MMILIEQHCKLLVYLVRCCSAICSYSIMQEILYHTKNNHCTAHSVWAKQAKQSCIQPKSTVKLSTSLLMLHHYVYTTTQLPALSLCYTKSRPQRHWNA